MSSFVATVITKSYRISGSRNKRRTSYFLSSSKFRVALIIYLAIITVLGYIALKMVLKKHRTVSYAYVRHCDENELKTIVLELYYVRCLPLDLVLSAITPVCFKSGQIVSSMGGIALP